MEDYCLVEDPMIGERKIPINSRDLTGQINESLIN
jgi:hypothetical protein